MESTYNTFEYAFRISLSALSMAPNSQSKAAERIKYLAWMMKLNLPSPMTSKVAREAQEGMSSTGDWSALDVIISLHFAPSFVSVRQIFASDRHFI